MERRTVPFQPERVPAAAELITDSYRRFLEIEPALPRRWLEADAIESALQVAAAHGPGVAAVDGIGRLVGFLIAELDLGGPLAEVGWPSDASLGGGRAAHVSIACHAAGGGDRAEVYREMYAALAPRLVEEGCYRHTIGLPICDSGAVQAWFSLGFGIDQVLGVRDVTSPAPQANPGVLVREASPDDIEALLSLAVDILAFHYEAPVFRPFYFAAEPVERDFDQALTDDQRKIFVAEIEGEVRGMFEISGIRRPSFNNARGGRDLTIGIASVAAGARFEGVGSALLHHVLRWAADAGLERCTVGWTAANLASSRFWTSRGFRPIQYTLARQLDERIAIAEPPASGA